MPTDDGGHRAAAVHALAERAYETAGDEYTRAGRRVLADPRDGIDPFTPDDKGWVGAGLAYLVLAAVAYRVAGRSTRAAHRATETVAVARDLRTALSHPAQRACLTEFVADARLAGGHDGHGEAYREAAEAYREAADAVADPRRRATTPLFEAAAGSLQQVARGAADGEVAVTWSDLHGDDPAAPGAFLAARATYKRSRFPAALSAAVDDDHLAAPRGTTAYDADAGRCPACGSTDVNWVADATLCLRCSSPLDTA